MNYGLLVLRLVAGGTMMFAHGWAKLTSYSQLVERFPDILGIGAAGNLALVIFAEFVCAGLIVLGLFTRLAAIPLMITMATAFFHVHSADPFQQKEVAFLFLGMFLSLFLAGPGAYSLQDMFKISAGRFAWLLK